MEDLERPLYFDSIRRSASHCAVRRIRRTGSVWR